MTDPAMSDDQVRAMQISAESDMRAHGLRPEEDEEFLRILREIALAENQPIGGRVLPTREQALRALRKLREG